MAELREQALAELSPEEADFNRQNPHCWYGVCACGPCGHPRCMSCQSVEVIE